MPPQSPYHSSPHSWAVQTCSWWWCSPGTGPGWHCWAAWWPWGEGCQCAVQGPSPSSYEATAHPLGHHTPAAWLRLLGMMMLLSLTTPFPQESKLAGAWEGSSPEHSATMGNDAGCIWCLHACKGCKGSSCEVTHWTAFWCSCYCCCTTVQRCPVCTVTSHSRRANLRHHHGCGCGGGRPLPWWWHAFEWGRWNLNLAFCIISFLVGGPVGCRLQNVLVGEQGVAQANCLGIHWLKSMTT